MRKSWRNLSLFFVKIPGQSIIIVTFYNSAIGKFNSVYGAIIAFNTPYSLTSWLMQFWTKSLAWLPGKIRMRNLISRLRNLRVKKRREPKLSFDPRLFKRVLCAVWKSSLLFVHLHESSGYKIQSFMPSEQTELCRHDNPWYRT